MEIRDKEITDDTLFIISEVGNQFNGDVTTAKKLIDVTHDAGADAVKFIFWFPDEILADNPDYTYQTARGWRTEPMKELLNRLTLTFEEWREVRDYALNKDIAFMATINSPSGIALAEYLMLDAIKISSWDFNFPDLWRWIAWHGVPMLIDLGPASEDEIANNLNILKGELNTNYALLHCFHTSNPAEANMLTIPYLKDRFRCPVGFSSTDYNDEYDIMAVALGASILEKRITLDRGGRVLHDAISKEPQEYKEYVAKMRCLKDALGLFSIKPSQEDLRQADKWYRRIVADVDIKQGEIIIRDMLEAKRGRTGIEPSRIWEFVGRKAARDIKRNETLTEEMART